MRWFRHTRSGVESTKLLPACAQPEAREDSPFVQGVFRVDSAGLCDGEGGLPARRAFLRVSDRLARVQGGRKSIRRSVRQAADSGAFRRQYSHYRHFRGGVGNQVHSYGIRFGCGRHPLSERELPLGAVLQWNHDHPLVL